MNLIHKILLMLYYLLWLLFIGLTYTLLTDRFYATGRWLAPLAGFLVISISIVVLVVLIALYLKRSEQRELNKRFIQLALFPPFLLIPFWVVKSIPNKLEQELHTIKVTFMAYGCECADWRIVKDNGIVMNDSTGEDIYLEPIIQKIELPDTMGYTGDEIELTGKFYVDKGYPAGYDPGEEQPEKARVFQYVDYRIISSGYENFKPGASE